MQNNSAATRMRNPLSSCRYDILDPYNLQFLHSSLVCTVLSVRDVYSCHWSSIGRAQRPQWTIRLFSLWIAMNLSIAVSLVSSTPCGMPFEVTGISIYLIYSVLHVPFPIRTSLFFPFLESLSVKTYRLSTDFVKQLTPCLNSPCHLE